MKLLAQVLCGVMAVVWGAMFAAAMAYAILQTMTGIVIVLRSLLGGA